MSKRASMCAYVPGPSKLWCRSVSAHENTEARHEHKCNTKHSKIHRHPWCIQDFESGGELRTLEVKPAAGFMGGAFEEC